MKTLLLFAFLTSFTTLVKSQTDTNLSPLIVFRQIPEYPDSFSAQTLLIRMIDGLGFRYYWATEGLRQQDLIWKPSADARTMEETLDHILSLVNIINNTINRKIDGQNANNTSLSFSEKRKLTIMALWSSREALQNTALKLDTCTIISDNGTNTSESFWFIINGPIEDALWHTGQVVSFRRSSGNPISSNINFLKGTLKN